MKNSNTHFDKLLKEYLSKHHTCQEVEYCPYSKSSFTYSSVVCTQQFSFWFFTNLHMSCTSVGFFPVLIIKLPCFELLSVFAYFVSCVFHLPVTFIQITEFISGLFMLLCRIPLCRYPTLCSPSYSTVCLMYVYTNHPRSRIAVS